MAFLVRIVVEIVEKPNNRTGKRMNRLMTDTSKRGQKKEIMQMQIYKWLIFNEKCKKIHGFLAAIKKMFYLCNDFVGLYTFLL